MTALDIEHRLEQIDDQWVLLVPPEIIDAALKQLESYRVENLPQAKPVVRLITVDSGWMGVLGFLAVIWLLPVLESDWVGDPNLRSLGRLDAGAVMNGEWWRTITALTLHADIGHLVGNSVFGAIFGIYVGRYLGSGFGWLLVVLCGAVGNALNAVIQPDLFRSIGASTATFSALAIGAAYIWRKGYFGSADWRRSMMPVIGAISLLAYTGVGGVNTDVMAHFTGFIAGFVTGTLAATFDIRRLGKSGQVLAASIALGLVGTAWMAAT